MDIGIEKASNGQTSEFNKTTKALVVILIIVGVVFCSIILRVQFKYHDKILQPENLSSPNVGLVFGAGLKARGVPGAVLEDRILTAIKLYQNNQIGKFILSGDNSTANHNEVQAMKNTALEQGLTEDILLLDHAGTSTYDSCMRVKQEFGLNKIVLITQKYHLRRALYLCNELGLDAVGVVAENRGYSKQLKYTSREVLASIDAWLSINILK